MSRKYFSLKKTSLNFWKSGEVVSCVVVVLSLQASKHSLSSSGAEQTHTLTAALTTQPGHSSASQQRSVQRELRRPAPVRWSWPLGRRRALASHSLVGSEFGHYSHSRCSTSLASYWQFTHDKVSRVKWSEVVVGLAWTTVVATYSVEARLFRLESPQAFKVEDQASYPGAGPPRPPTGSLWPHPLTPPPSSTDLQAGSNPISAASAAASHPSHLSLHAHHTDLSGSMKGKILIFTVFLVSFFLFLRSII